MIKRKVIYLLIIFFACNLYYLPVISQSLNFRSKTIDNGLSNNSVNCIAEDKQGFIWIGTEDGLNRFDGYDIAIYRHNPASKSGLGSNQINALCCDVDGNMWISCINGGLYKYNSDQDIFQEINLGAYKFNTKKIGTICSGKEGDIWIGTHNSSFAHYIKARNSWEVFSLAASAGSSVISIHEIAEDRDRNVWMATSDGIFKYDQRKREIIPIEFSLKEKWTSNIFINNAGKVLSIIERSVVSINRDNDASASVWFRNIPDYSFIINAVEPDKSGNLWIAASLGLLKTSVENIQKSQVIDYARMGNITLGAVRCIFIDSHDNIWVGSWFGGVYYMNPGENFKQFRHYKPLGDDFPRYNNVVRCILEDENRLWAGTDWSGLHSIDLTSQKIIHYFHEKEDNKSLKENIITALYKDSKGRFWVGSYGLMRYNNKRNNFDFYNIDTLSARNPDILQIEEINDNLLLLLTNKGLFYFDIGKGKSLMIPELQASGSAEFTTLCRDDADHFWIGTAEGLLYTDLRTKETKKYLQYAAIRNSLSHNQVKCLLKDRKKRIWIGTSNGLNLYNPVSDNFIVFNSHNGFSNNLIQGILEDAEGNLWISTNGGITKFRISELSDDDYKGSNIQYLLENYTVYDGLQSNQFFPNSSFKLKSGALAFGGVNGITCFYPDSIRIRDNQLKPSFTGLRIFNKYVVIHPDRDVSPLQQHINFTDRIRLSHKQSVITFEYVAFNYIAPEKISYAYRMDGFDTEEDNWNFVEQRRNATYTNLAPGKYTFRVKATDNPSNWGTEEKRIDIVILPPWWKTILFKIGFLVFATLFIVGIYNLRIRDLKNRQKILERRIEQRTAELTVTNKKLEEQTHTLRKINDTLEEKQVRIVEQSEEIIKQKDILENKNIELEKKNQEIIRITDQLHKADQSKINFFTNVSHELRTPLTLILGPLESIISGLSRESPMLNRLNIIKVNAGRLMRLVNQLLDFRKIDSDSVQLHTEHHDVVLFIRQIVEAFRMRADSRKITFSMTSSEESVITWFDPDIIDKIIYNLLSNAFKFTPNGGKISLELELMRKPTGKRQIQEKLMIRVSDTGIGISRKDQAKVFERFYQADQSTTRKYEGSGIGLALTRQLAEIHLGSISVKSEPGEGSCFEVILAVGDRVKPLLLKQSGPLSTVSVIQDPGKDDIITDELPETYFSGATILVVEDNEDLRHFIRDEIGMKYKIIEAENGQEGFEVALKEIPDLIISDVMMPVMDGFELCEKIKMEWQTSHIPVILLTAKADEESLYQGLEIGADAYLKKPFQIKHLCKQIENLLENRKKLFDKFSKSLVPGLEMLSDNSADKEFLVKLYQLTEANIGESGFGVEALASQLNMSRSQLYKKTMSIAGMPVGGLIRDLRLKKAAHLLLNKKHSVSDVALMVGFTDRPQFTRSFTNLFGINPKQFQIQGKDRIQNQ